MAAMKKTYYYTFLPDTQEDIALAAATGTHIVTRTLVEIRDDTPFPAMLFPSSNTPTLPTSSIDPIPNEGNQWRIRKKLDIQEIAMSKIRLSHEDVFEHVFRYSTLESAKMIVAGSRVRVSLCDMTDESTPIMYGPYDDETFIERGSHDEFVLGLNSDLVRARGFKQDDVVGITYDPRTHVFYFKALF